MYLVLIATDAGSIVAYIKQRRVEAEIYAAMMLDEIEAKDKSAIESIQQYLSRHGMRQATTIYGVQLLMVKRNRFQVQFWRAGNDSAPTGNAGNNPPRRRAYGASGNNEARPRGSELHDLRKNGQFFTGGGIGESEPGGDRDERPETRKPRRKRG